MICPPAKPTVPPAEPETATTIKLSPSASVSFAAGLPAPEAGRIRTASSTVVALSSTATGLSSAAAIVIDTVAAADVCPSEVAVKLKLSTPKALGFGV